MMQPVVGSMAGLRGNAVSPTMLSTTPTACKSCPSLGLLEWGGTFTGSTRMFNNIRFTLEGKREVKALSKLPVRWNGRTLHRGNRSRLAVNCRRTDEDSDSSGEEPPETLFMKELKRRGMTPGSLFEESDRNPYGLGGTETKTREEGSEGFTSRNDIGVSTGFDDRSRVNQRELSMQLNSEGLEGLIPRAKVLLTLGGTFFFMFWPLILSTLVLFSAVYIYFGPSFIHDGGKLQTSQPTNIDPYKLLEDERLTPQGGPQRYGNFERGGGRGGAMTRSRLQRKQSVKQELMKLGKNIYLKRFSRLFKKRKSDNCRRDLQLLLGGIHYATRRSC